MTCSIRLMFHQGSKIWICLTFLKSTIDYSNYLYWNTVATPAARWDTEIGTTVHLGSYAGSTSQQGGAIAIGWQAGRTSQYSTTIAIGWQAGESSQGSNAIAIGYQAGNFNQSTGSIAIGYQASIYGNLQAINFSAGYCTTSQSIQLFPTSSSPISISFWINFSSVPPSTTYLLAYNK